MDVQKLERKLHKHTTKENHQTAREGIKRKEEERRTTKAPEKQVRKCQ